jgi:hypothetical protein
VLFFYIKDSDFEPRLLLLLLLLLFYPSQALEFLVIRGPESTTTSAKLRFEHFFTFYGGIVSQPLCLRDCKVDNCLLLLLLLLLLLFFSFQALEFLVIRGPESTISSAKSEFSHYLHHLSHFDYIGPGGHDYGISVRIRSQALAALLSNPEHLQQQRAAAAARSRSLYGGYSRDDMIRQQQQHTGEGSGEGEGREGGRQE